MDLRDGGLANTCALERELAVPRVDPHRVAVRKLAFEQAEGKRVLDHALDRTLERPGAVGGIPAGVGEHLLRVVRQLELDSALGQTPAQTRELQLDDLGELL